MANIDKLTVRVESLIEKVRALKFDFSNSDSEIYAKEVLEEAVTGLESFLELATEDVEEHSECESD